MKAKIFLLISIISIGTSYANDELLSDPNLCPSLTATNRAQITTYTGSWPNCKHLIDHLTIRDVNYDKSNTSSYLIKDFDKIEEIDNLIISSTAKNYADLSLFFFSSLKKINSDITLDNISISSGFQNLTSIENMTLKNGNNAKFPLVEKINNLSIFGEENNIIYGFESFTTLKEVDGELKISNLLIKDLSGLPKLKSVNNFIIKNNPWLAELNLPSIRTINYLSIENNSFFQDLKSLSKSEVGTLRLINLQNLYSLNGIPYHLDKLIIDNVPLNDVSALEGVNIDINKPLEISLINATGSEDYLCELLEPVIEKNQNISAPQCDFNH
ncbi:hypothetical protein D5R81_11680 [Parashewanella spongiae]|uniref:Leucine-rich repeat domain-containing protein n=1 Tax=Parashewanella spongiae TaxID=342950 RepID=A0A3A6TXD4_9GAMM|nr:hypothetical protein [Parashewanella spongiae]MCL1077601.1 hypothetical protein [Parashewanella spongiae]RJY13171.1 hypothetical protein D5R81_11680 [Parashewanella spongiae]